MKVIRFALFVLGMLYMVNAQATPFNAQAKTEILQEHNQLRSQLAKGTYKDGNNRVKPAAADMTKLVWDDSLAASAQKVSNTCKMQHSGTPKVGENLYSASASNGFPDPQSLGKKAVEAWNSEFTQYGWKDLRYSSSVGHATQDVWAQTRRVGCGLTLCNGGKNAYVACQYSPQGNFQNQDAYKTGNTCSLCPEGTKCDASGLCA